MPNLFPSAGQIFTSDFTLRIRGSCCKVRIMKSESLPITLNVLIVFLFVHRKIATGGMSAEDKKRLRHAYQVDKNHDE